LEIKSATPILRAKEVFSLKAKTRIIVNIVAEILKVMLFTRLLARVDLYTFSFDILSSLQKLK